MVSRLSLKVTETVAIGSYTLFICELLDAEVLGSGDCLTVKEFEKRGEDVPPVAPVYHELSADAGMEVHGVRLCPPGRGHPGRLHLPDLPRPAQQIC